MPVPAVLAWHGRSFIYLRQLVQKRGGGGEVTPWEEGERRDFADCRTLYLPHPLPPRSLAFFRHDSIRLTMGIWVVERLMLVSTARGQPRISTIEPGKFDGRPREWFERRHRFGNINQRLLETWTFGFCNSSSADFFRGSHSLEKIFILFRNNFRERSEEDGSSLTIGTKWNLRVSSNKCLQASHKRHLYLFIWSTKPLYGCWNDAVNCQCCTVIVK